ncbi:hypothetical protein DERF_000278 [Dermatophagoides farinae]|uniref:Uncharacterized protein n=1 Tax=Dermatophagoides farinae TaxID=6954 RepID=A0A922I9M4_DERFA|nr:hypothetical protein DERF_000278 [Dermatophagoides farinae]
MLLKLPSWDGNYRVQLNDLFHEMNLIVDDNYRLNASYRIIIFRCKTVKGNATSDLAIIVIIEISKNHGIFKHSCNDIKPSIKISTI